MDGMSSEQSSRHLPGKWSAAELLEHLYLSYAGTINGFEKVMQAGKPLGTRASMAHRVQTFVVVGLGYMPWRTQSACGGGAARCAGGEGAKRHWD